MCWSHRAGGTGLCVPSRHSSSVERADALGEGPSVNRRLRYKRRGQGPSRRRLPRVRVSAEPACREYAAVMLTRALSDRQCVEVELAGGQGRRSWNRRPCAAPGVERVVLTGARSTASRRANGRAGELLWVFDAGQKEASSLDAANTFGPGESSGRVHGIVPVVDASHIVGQLARRHARRSVRGMGAPSLRKRERKDIAGTLLLRRMRAIGDSRVRGEFHRAMAGPDKVRRGRSRPVCETQCKRTGTDIRGFAAIFAHRRGRLSP